MQREGDLVEDDRGKGNGEQKNQKRKAQSAEHREAEEGPDEAGQQEEEGDAGRKEIGAIDAENQDGKAEDDEGSPIQVGESGCDWSTFRLSQMRKIAKKGTRKPWE